MRDLWRSISPQQVPHKSKRLILRRLALHQLFTKAEYRLHCPSRPLRLISRRGRTLHVEDAKRILEKKAQPIKGESHNEKPSEKSNSRSLSRIRHVGGGLLHRRKRQRPVRSVRWTPRVQHRYGHASALCRKSLQSVGCTSGRCRSSRRSNRRLLPQHFHFQGYWRSSL